MNRSCMGLLAGLAAFVLSGTVRADGGGGMDEIAMQVGDRICIIGNTTAERMQHDGWLETMLHQRFPKEKLVIRNLGFSGDELTLRLRSMDFGSQDEWLTRCKADAVWAFFGFNESFQGAAGL